MRRFYGCVVCLIVTCVVVTTSSAKEKPNVLFIAIDDLNDWIGCLDGHPQALTPNIDRLAARGLLFTNAHCASPACNPSRSTIFSGEMPWRTGVWSNESKKLVQLHRDKIVLSKAFAAAGYETLATGKLLHSEEANQAWFNQEFTPEQRWSPLTKKGTDYTKQEQASKGSDNPRHVARTADGRSVVLPLNRMPSDRNPDNKNGESFDWGPFDVPDSDMGDTQITDWAINKLNAGFDKPFFLAVGYYRPHIPLWAPKQYFQRFDGVEIQLPRILQNDLSDIGDTGRKWAVEAVTAGLHESVLKHNQWQEAVKAYLACTTFVDHQVGRLLDALDSGKYGTNTSIVLWSDHGWHLGEKQHWGKWTGWERSTRVPLMIVPPQNIADKFAKSGQRCDAPVSLIDLYPTLTELCDVKPPYELDGESLVPLLHNPQRITNRIVVTVFDKGNISLRNDVWRFISYADGSEELYNLKVDPNEWYNVVQDAENTKTVEQFRDAIPNWING